MAQTSRFVVLSMDLPLKTTCTHWINTYLEFFLRISNGFGLIFDSNLFWWNPYGFIRFTTVFHVVNHGIFLRLWKILGFQAFWTKPVWNLTDLCWFRFVNVLEYEEVSFDFHLCFIRRFDLESSELFDFDSVCWFLAWNPEINRWFFFFFFTGSKPLQFFPFSSQILFFVIVLSLLLSAMNSVLELQRKGSMMRIQPWIFESCHGFHGFGLNLLLEILGFANLFFNFLSFLWFWSNWMERECCTVFVMWRNLFCSFSDWCSAWPYIGCHVAFEPMEMWHMDWYCLRGTLD